MIEFSRSRRTLASADAYLAAPLKSLAECPPDISSLRSIFTAFKSAVIVGLEPTYVKQCKGFWATWRFGKLRGVGRCLGLQEEHKWSNRNTICGFLSVRLLFHTFVLLSLNWRVYTRDWSSLT